LVCGAVVTVPSIWRFACDQRAEEFQLKLGARSKVEEAREAAARRYGKPKEAVELQFAEMPLPDRMLMERLRLGALKIQVILREEPT
jgi:hypothetical protein